MRKLFLVVLYFVQDDSRTGTFEYLIEAADVPDAVAGVMMDMSVSHKNFDRLTVEERHDIVFLHKHDEPDYAVVA